MVKILNVLLIALCSLFIGCNNPLSQPDNIPAGKGAFSLSVTVARTILPALDQSKFILYTLDFEPESGDTVQEERSPAELADPVYLEPGTYALVVKAYLDSGKTKLAARGSETVTINAGENTSKVITLKAIIEDGTGSFIYTVNFPDVETATMNVTPLNAGSQGQDRSLSSGVTGTLTLNSGYYNMAVTLVKTDGQTLVWRELLHVYSNLESIFDMEFSNADFYKTKYTVTFVFDNGDGNGMESVVHGAQVTEPADPTRDGFEFGGWYSDSGLTAEYEFSTPVVSNITLYAKWIETFTPEDLEDFGPAPFVIEDPFNVYTTEQWNNAVALISNGGPNKNYIINILADFDVAGVTNPNTTFTGTGIKVSLRGVGRTVGLSSNGSLIRIGANQTVILRGLTLKGRESNDDGLVGVAGGTFIMQSGKITGNSKEWVGQYAGVYVEGGTFTMNGGTISDNYNYQGGGVYVGNEGTFTMNSGTISGNVAYNGGGGGVCVEGGTFAMHGGTIYDNSSSSYRGGGVYVDGTFAMHGGTISGNYADTGGGGVYVVGTFAMHGGTISGNESSNYGGGVYVVGTFDMHGGTISGNTASDDGGGVSVHDNTGVFRIVTGTIYGIDEADESLRNTSTYGRAALFKATASTAQRGTFADDGTWTSSATLATTNNTIQYP